MKRGIKTDSFVPVDYHIVLLGIIVSAGLWVYFNFKLQIAQKERNMSELFNSCAEGGNILKETTKVELMREEDKKGNDERAVIEVFAVNLGANEEKKSEISPFSCCSPFISPTVQIATLS